MRLRTSNRFPWKALTYIMNESSQTIGVSSFQTRLELTTSGLPIGLAMILAGSVEPAIVVDTASLVQT
ncbi:hypothetical protein [Sphingobium yanoikuyae]|uniref:Uncharacterized protein n=1 Tax=Sphingobium yanoikuyae TaxID=13690 RepID=A0A9X7U5B6_SPHYA|nr:hypothetical protein [Sphingobium yanoikuyae]QNG43502.1 hypothetical protein H3V42_16135 [Sphingobium yanoikuyae]